MTRPFYFRIDLVDLMDFATDPAGETMSLLAFSKELKRGESNFPAIQKIIDEAGNYLEKKRSAGRKGAAVLKQCSSSATAVLQHRSAVPKPETETETEINIKDVIPYSEIIKDLNEKGDFSFRVGEATKRLIHARFSEGFTKNDFEKVHITKIAEWSGNKEMSKYLRPETLYGNKFQGYLNQRVPENKCKIEEWQ